MLVNKNIVLVIGASGFLGSGILTGNSPEGSKARKYLDRIYYLSERYITELINEIGERIGKLEDFK